MLLLIIFGIVVLLQDQDQVEQAVTLERPPIVLVCIELEEKDFHTLDLDTLAALEDVLLARPGF